MRVSFSRPMAIPILPPDVDITNIGCIVLSCCLSAFCVCVYFLFLRTRQSACPVRLPIRPAPGVQLAGIMESVLFTRLHSRATEHFLRFLLHLRVSCCRYEYDTNSAKSIYRRSSSEPPANVYRAIINSVPWHLFFLVFLLSVSLLAVNHPLCRPPPPPPLRFP